MTDATRDLSFLNIYEVEDEAQGRTRHMVGFMDPVLAGAVGLASHAMVGEFTPKADGAFDPDTFAVNPEFLDAVTGFLNDQVGRSPDLEASARAVPSKRLYIVDPRNHSADDEDPPTEDVLGWFEVDEAGRVVPESFQYNAQHLWFSTASGVSGLLMDEAFYGFLHPMARRGDAER
jgi:hypothetical protein